MFFYNLIFTGIVTEPSVQRAKRGEYSGRPHIINKICIFCGIEIDRGKRKRRKCEDGKGKKARNWHAVETLSFGKRIESVIKNRGYDDWAMEVSYQILS